MFRTGVARRASTSPADELRARLRRVVLAGGADAAARPAGARPRARRASTSRWSSCRSRTGACAGDAVAGARSILRDRQARHHHRRRRHRLRLPRHRAPAGRAIGAPVRAAARAARRARRRARPGPLADACCAPRARTRRACDRATGASTPSASSATRRPRDGSSHGVRLEWAPGRGRPAADAARCPAASSSSTADLVLLAWASSAPSTTGLLSSSAWSSTTRGNVAADARLHDQRARRVRAGDMRRGQSLVVWAICGGPRGGARRRHVPDGRDRACRQAREL